ncbi:MAG: hypothetical protein KatS3mg129_1310 [Leptospiraceae bacterium]|nr:MAG: hypothetical protein KatS3mg129_1310 [Leptospiraceae bacterium]
MNPIIKNIIKFIIFTFLVYSLNAQEKENTNLFINFLEISLIQFKNKDKPPEDLGSVLNSIRISNQYLSNNPVFSYQKTEIKEKKPKRRISYTIKPKDSNYFFNFQYAFYNDRLEYRKYFDTNLNFTLDTYINDNKELLLKFGYGPLDYFEDSGEVSFYYFEYKSRGTYRVQTRLLTDLETPIVSASPELFLIYNAVNSATIYYNDGTITIKTKGMGIFTGFNVKFFRRFSLYNILDLQFFSINGKFSSFSPVNQYYNTSTNTFQTTTQIVLTEKKMNLNMNLYYELGFSFTINKVGFKYGWYWDMPIILDTDYLNPKGYIIYLTNPVKIEQLETSINLFYKGDPSNQTKTFTIGLGGIVFGVVTKF